MSPLCHSRRQRGKGMGGHCNGAFGYRQLGLQLDLALDLLMGDNVLKLD